MASRRGRRIVTAAFLIFAAGFIVTSTVDIGQGVYGKPIANGVAPPPTPECIAGIKSLANALDRGLSVATSANDESMAIAAFLLAGRPEWDTASDTDSACSTTPRGKDAFAALLRLRAADVSFLRRHMAEVAPLRRDVDAYLR
ncbi:MAG: hypothetical protein ACRELY_27975 [Polyangiaceae bacterium]